MDTDPEAIEIARQNLDGANLRVADSLLDRADARYTVVLGNPPWTSYSGRHRTPIAPERLDALLGRYPAMSAWPSTHAAFFLLGERLLLPDGNLGFVAPMQFAFLDRYERVRRQLDDHFLTRVIEDAGETSFDGVCQRCGLFGYLGRGGRSFRAAEGHGMHPAMGDIFFDIGVHTGNLGRKVVVNEPMPGAVPFREGKDIQPFVCSETRRWLLPKYKVQPGEYWRFGSLERARAIPILLRQTANRPIAAIHTEPTYFRNSVLACTGIPGIDHRVTLAVLNSEFMAETYRRMFPDSDQRTFPQVKVRALRQLPMFEVSRLTTRRSAEICRAVDRRDSVQAEEHVRNIYRS